MKISSFITLTSSVVMALVINVHADKPGTTKLGKNKTKVVLVETTALHTTFAIAKKAFVGKDTKASAVAISEAGAMLSTQEVAAVPAHAAPLGKAVGNLNELAKSVGAGDVKDVKVLDQAFANTHQTLAEYYQGKAQRAHEAGDKTVAAKSMQAAANHAENGATWAGTKLSDTAKGTVSLMRKVSGGILSGTGSGVEKVGDVLGKGTKTITDIGSKVRGTGAAPEASVAEKAVKGVQGVAGGAVETTGKVTEKATGAVSGTGKGLKKLGDAVKGAKKESVTSKKDQ